VARTVAAAAAVLALAAAPAAESDPGKVGYPSAITALGDSITKAYNTGLRPFRDDASYSWATGTRSSVGSAYLRIRRANPGIDGRRVNAAKDGARMRDLVSQAETAVRQGAEYVTVMLGSNDVCRPSEARMTTVPTFRAQLESGLRVLSAGLPDARIQLVSIPDVYRLWELYRGSFVARTVWETAGICRSLLARARSSSRADVERRAHVRERTIAFNRQLAEVCAAYVHCRFDGNAVFVTRFAKRDISPLDYFHPSRSGQARLAAVVWAKTFDFRDATAPSSVASAVPGGTQTVVTIAAFDETGVAGVEYRLAAGPYLRYVGPVALAPGQTLVYRAVDVNGNVEATHDLIG
jgi:lysophospholipase L1-like esterase